ncbi:MAG: alpha-galactosidase [Spirochaetes bacterium]|nr:alpha-galactosidase [Spirochaetota bacterium]
MNILYNPGTREFHLRNDFLSYVMCVRDDGRLAHLHFGSPLSAGSGYRHLLGRSASPFSKGSGDLALMECPARGWGDFRMPALEAEFADGSRSVDPRYEAHRVRGGKPVLRGLPSTYVEEDGEATTLEIDLRDAPGGALVTLSYTVFRDYPAISRSVSVMNEGGAPMRIACAMSACLDLGDSDWELRTYGGAWARERHESRRKLASGHQGVSSARGASSLQQGPFMCLARPGTDEGRGEAIGMSLVYSGNFVAEAEVGPFGTTRARIGIDPATFSWRLGPGESFQSPEAVIVHSRDGLGALSDAYHRLYRGRLARGPWRDRPRPVLVNNWEGTYFDFTEEKILAMADAARDLGVELFVLDDGWFGERDDDTSSLGDWVENRRKLPGGLSGLASAIEARGMRFGVWIEPEMVSRNSRLFEARPDWAVGVPGRERTSARNQYVLDMSNPAVVDHLHAEMSRILGSASISYVKWDMNRNITDAWGSSLGADRQGEFFHRYILGVYELYRRVTSDFPDVLFESCAAGGGRFDPGILAYAPQGWVSDDSDAIERLAIQWGTSMCYPLSSMGAHVSAVPNHQTGRVTPLSTRAATSFFGVLGYELDTSALTSAERLAISEEIAFYKDHRQLFQRGRFLRLRSPFERDGNVTAWMVASDDGRTAIAGYWRTLNRPAPAPDRLRARGLDPEAAYRVSLWPRPAPGPDRVRDDNEGIRRGDELMSIGLLIGDAPTDSPSRGDFWSILFILEAE